jgi:hypothetical protein
MLPGCARVSRCSSAAFGPEAPPSWRDEHEQPVVAESLQQKGRGLGAVVRLGVQQDQEIALGGSDRPLKPLPRLLRRIYRLKTARFIGKFT